MIRVRVLVVLLLVAFVAVTVGRGQQASPPNILVVLADDLGIEALGAYGGEEHSTPNIDALIARGMRFTHCFSNPTCSPSRATLLTGRYSFRHGVKRVIWHPEQHRDIYLRVEQPSFARQLQQRGYATAIAGKWQLSFLDQRNTIRALGFEEYQCWQIHDANGARTRRYHHPHFVRNGEVVAAEIAQRYGPDVNVDFLVDFIHRSVRQRRPFLAYHTCLLPHYPWVPTPDSDDGVDPLAGAVGSTASDKGDPRYFPDMVAYLDKSVGRLLRELDEAGVARDTIVIFLADNGTDVALQHRFAGGHVVAGGKGTMTDRGTRVPLVVRWPGVIEPGSVCDDLIDFTDLLPTLCELAGAPVPNGIDGRSFVPQLRGERGDPRQWVQIQDHERRHLRSREFVFDVRGELRPVVELWRSPAAPFEAPLSPAQAAARRRFEAVFRDLGAR